MAVATALHAEKPRDVEPVYGVRAERVQELPSVIRAIARLFDGARTTSEVAAAAQISATQCAAIIEKLTALGILHRVRPRRPTAPHATPFTPTEEAFFASDVPPIDECNEPFVTMGEKLRSAVCEVIVRLQGQRSTIL